MSDTERKRTQTVDDEPARDTRGRAPGRRGVGPSGSSGPSEQDASPEMQAVETTSGAARPTGDGAWEFDDRLRAAMGLRRSTPAARTPAGPVRSADAAWVAHAGQREGSESAVQMRAAEPRPTGDGAWEFDDRLRGAMGLRRPTPAARTTPDERAGTTSATTGGETPGGERNR